MELCETWGIPHSIFLGRPWPKPGEALWLDEDQDKAIAYFLFKKESCAQCGTREEDWVDESGRYLNPPKLEPIAVRCHGCETKEQFQDSLPKGATQRGVYVAFRKFDPRNPVKDEPQIHHVHQVPDELDLTRLNERGWRRTPYTN